MARKVVQNVLDQADASCFGRVCAVCRVRSKRSSPAGRVPVVVVKILTGVGTSVAVISNLRFKGDASSGVGVRNREVDEVGLPNFNLSGIVRVT